MVLQCVERIEIGNRRLLKVYCGSVIFDSRPVWNLGE